MAQPMGRWERPPSAYSRWVQGEGVPTYAGSYVANLHHAEVQPWARFGVKGALISLASQEQNDGWLMEIPPGGKTEPAHHLFEATYFVVDGRGATTIWQKDSDKKQTVEWQPGSLFSPPLNANYQHFNLDGQKPARLFAATTAPLQINAVQNGEFAFNCDYVFKERYDAADDFFTDPGKMVATRMWETNFIPDTRTFKLEEWKERGGGGTNMFFLMSGNAMSAHMSEFATGSYKKGHRHGPGAEIIILSGTGYSLLWFPGQKEPIKVDWQEGSLFSPRDGEYHQHFNTGQTRARYLAYTFGRLYYGNTMANRAGADVSEKEGGWQVEYEDEDPAVFKLFEAECKRNGAEVTLDHPQRRARV